MYRELYLEVYVIACLILSHILHRMYKNGDNTTTSKIFKAVCWSLICIMAFDEIGIVALDYSNLRTLAISANCLYMFFAGLIPFIWYYYVDYKLKGHEDYTTIEKVAIVTPLFILLVCVILTPLFHTLFYIDNMNVYHRGSLHFIQVIVSYSYIFVATMHCFSRYRKCVLKQDKDEAMTLLCFGLLPAIGGAIETFTFGLPALWPSCAVGIMIVFIDFQDYQISIDNLTRLHNRRSFDNYIQKANMNDQDLQVYLLLIDVNDFKGINDIYGHVSGDKALAYVGKKIKECSQDKNAFSARYGGDEFAIVYHCDNEQEAIDLKNEVMKAIEQDNHYDFELKVSIGISKVDTQNTIESIIENADQELYQEKTKTKKADS